MYARATITKKHVQKKKGYWLKQTTLWALTTSAMNKGGRKILKNAARLCLLIWKRNSYRETPWSKNGLYLISRKQNQRTNQDVSFKVSITPKIFLARHKSLHRTKQDSAKISSFGWNLDFLWIFKVGKKRPHLKHYRVKNYQIGSGSSTIRDVIPGFLL